MSTAPGTVAPGVDRATTQWLDRAVLRVVALAMAFMAALVVLSPTLLHGGWSAPAQVVGLAALGGWLVCLLAAVVLQSADLRLLYPLPAICLATGVALLVLPHDGPVPFGQHWLTHPTVIAANVALLLLPTLHANLLIAVLWVEVTALNAPAMGWLRSAAQTLVLVIGPYAVLLLARLLATQLSQLRTASTERARATERARVAGVAAAERGHWDRVIHDQVLAALVTGAQATTPDLVALARRTAREALAEIEVGAPAGGAPSDWTVRLEQFARTLGLQPEVRVRGPLPPADVADAVERAARQALTNTARHAGTDRVRVEVLQSEARVLVVVADDGVGFDPERVPGGRLGVRESIPGHLAAIGGTASIESRPGAGTTVRLAWERADHTEPAVPSVLRGVQRLPLVRLVLGWGAVHLVLGAQYLEGIAHPLLSVAGLACYLTGVGVAVTTRWRSLVTASSTLLLGASLLLTLGADPMRAADGRLWYAGAIMPLACVLALMGRAAAALLLGSGALAAMVAGWGLVGGTGPALGALEAGAQLLVFPLTCVLLDQTLARAARRTADVERATAEQRARASAATARLAEGERRTAQLELGALPLLRSLADGGEVGSAEVSAYRRTEAETRDQLVGGPLVDARVRREVRAARERGAAVEVTAEVDVGESPAELERHLDGVRAVLVHVLPKAGDGTEVVARWNPVSGYVVGSVVVNSPATTVRADELWALLVGLDPVVEVDHDSVLVNLRPPGAP